MYKLRSLCWKPVPRPPPLCYNGRIAGDSETLKKMPRPLVEGNPNVVKHKICVVPITHPEFKGLRITPNAFAALPELDRIRGVMDGIARKGLPD